MKQMLIAAAILFVGYYLGLKKPNLLSPIGISP